MTPRPPWASPRCLFRRPAPPRHANLSTRPRLLEKADSEDVAAAAAAAKDTASTTRTLTRLDHMIARLPRRLHPYIAPLRAAPVSHITSFLLLHEITALVPLIAIATFFHYADWVPASLTSSQWMSDGVQKFGRYFSRKGWFGVGVGDGEPGSDLSGEDELVNVVESVDGNATAPGQNTWAANSSEKGMRVVLEVAAAWAVTKALFPARIALSLWATPWFAKVGVVPVLSVCRGLLRRLGRRK